MFHTFIRAMRMLPRERVLSLFAMTCSEFIKGLPPGEALRFLFELDTKLYGLQSEKAILFGEGIHTKHRHMRYHDFFVGKITSGERVLDVGCGCGAVAFDLASRAGAEVVGVDIDPANVELACRLHGHPKIEYLAGDIVNGVVSGNFDVIVLSNVLEHMTERVEFLKESTRQFKPKIYLIRVPLFERDWRVPLRKEVGAEWRLDTTHDTEYTLETFHDEMAAAGLEITHLEVRWGELWSELRPLKSP